MTEIKETDDGGSILRRVGSAMIGAIRFILGVTARSVLYSIIWLMVFAFIAGFLGIPLMGVEGILTVIMAAIAYAVLKEL